MASLKASDIDGYSALFFQKFWPIVGEDITTFFFSVLNGEIGIECVNKGVLESCIYKAQGAFILGRQIFDNVLVAYKVLHSLKLKGNGATRAQIGRERLAASHLFFADDYILFGDASIGGVENVQKVVIEYENASSQQVNYDKSLIYFSANVDISIRDQIGDVLGVKVNGEVRELFDKELVKRVLRIPIGRSQVADEMI
ncbi:hypothetical protein J1N35_038145 [Gossypium stocksii]|uniref:Reverse transcriptase n=1 Tax=Gossypium stocksii TaxID=47602 RepID=A0A9D3ULC7_9ROSI|nr:hypothetical protein J1N35_038145 [Gossypium stocksii]